MYSNKQYLGDSVYAEFDGFAVTLTTENGLGPDNTIIIEPDVLHALNDYVTRMKELYAKLAEKKQNEIPT